MVKFNHYRNQIFLVQCGLKPKEAIELLATLDRWMKESGPEWTNKRVKDIRQWYETYLSGHCSPPSWFKKRNGIPKGVFGKVFQLKPKKALLVLSLNTQLILRDSKNKKVHPLDGQLTKALHGREGNGFVFTKEIQVELENLLKEYEVTPKGWTHPDLHKDLRAIDISDITDENASTIPLRDGKAFMVKSSKWSKDKQAVRSAIGYALSLESIPETIQRFYFSNGGTECIPFCGRLLSAIADVKPSNAKLLAEYGYTGYPQRSNKIVGRIGYIQEEQLKLRVVANPHKACQVALEPLAEMLYGTLRGINATGVYTVHDQDGNPKKVFTKPRGFGDCTYDQESGVKWVSEQLAAGVTLAGVDLSNATDLLSLDASLCILNNVYFNDLQSDRFYQNQLKLFKEISRADWYDPELESTTSWKQGQPMGLNVSFATLALVNNAVGRLACKMAGLTGSEFRVIGDDFICYEQAVPYYEDIMTRLLGGEINRSKTLTSSLVAEFGGRVVFPKYWVNKATKLPPYLKVSDENFFTLMSKIGDSFKFILNRDQKTVWDEFKFVPGIVLGDPWSLDSFGEPLQTRVQWYLDVIETNNFPVREIDSSPNMHLVKVLHTLGIVPEKGFEDGQPVHDLDTFVSNMVRTPGRRSSKTTTAWNAKRMQPITDTNGIVLGYLPRKRPDIPKGDPRKWDQRKNYFRRISPVHKNFGESCMKLIGSSAFTRYTDYKSNDYNHQKGNGTVG